MLILVVSIGQWWTRGLAATACLLVSAGSLWSVDFITEVRRGEEFARKGQSAEVRKLVTSLSTTTEGKPYARLLQARALFAAGETAQAEALLAQVFPQTADVAGAPPQLQVV